MFECVLSFSASNHPFTPFDTIFAVCRVASDHVKPDVVASEMGISLNSVCFAKSRVTGRLRREAKDLIESSSTFLTKS